MSVSPTPIRARLAAGILAGALAVGLAGAISVPAQAQSGQIRGLNSRDAIAGQYIVVYKDAAIGKMTKARQFALTDRLAFSHGATVKYRYSAALRGFAAKMTLAEAKKLAADPFVAYVEQNKRVKADATQSPATWGLDRIDQRDLPLNNSYTYGPNGSGVTAYIIDTGIRTTHSDFGGRAVWGINQTGDGNNTDCNGHGTHVAGTVGGATYGVAKGVQLVAVKVLGCNGSGSTAGVVAGIDWVTGNHAAGAPAVANMSLGGGADTALDNAVRNSIADGITYAVASGNSNANACNYSPARVAEAITVNASTNTDARASFSNFGTCTDIFAPGQDITSAWITNNTSTNTISGTSMATPHVAGAAALILAGTPGATPATVASTLFNNATLNKVTNPGTGSPNRLLYTGAGTTPPNTCAARTNGADVSIPDNTTVTSSIVVSGCTGNASAATTVEVHIVHTYRGDLVVSLVAPDGTAYVLHNRAGGSADNIDQVFTVNASSEAINGTWVLRVQDAASADTGYINSWTLDV